MTGGAGLWDISAPCYSRAVRLHGDLIAIFAASDLLHQEMAVNRTSSLTALVRGSMSSSSTT